MNTGFALDANKNPDDASARSFDAPPDAFAGKTNREIARLDDYRGNFRPTKSQKKSAPIFDDFCRIPIVLNEFALDTIKNNVASLDETSAAWVNVTSLATEQRIYR